MHVYFCFEIDKLDYLDKYGYSNYFALFDN